MNETTLPAVSTSGFGSLLTASSLLLPLALQPYTRKNTPWRMLPVNENLVNNTSSEDCRFYRHERDYEVYLLRPRRRISVACRGPRRYTPYLVHFLQPGRSPTRPCSLLWFEAHTHRFLHPQSSSFGEDGAHRIIMGRDSGRIEACASQHTIIYI